MPQAPVATDAYRNNWDVPTGKETIAVGTIDNDNRTIIGVNSRAPGYTNEDRAAANAMRANLLIRDPDVMRNDNTGYKPNDAIYHAEATALMRAARMSGGSLNGHYLNTYVDRPMCESCDKGLLLVARELGYPTVRFTDIYGRRRTLRNGEWE
jgi:MafB19-like deaminase